MDAGGPKTKLKSDINITPMIDIVLVLLIVFIVMVPGLDKATKVVVPQVQVLAKPPAPDPNNILIQIDQDGAFHASSPGFAHTAPVLKGIGYKGVGRYATY